MNGVQETLQPALPQAITGEDQTICLGDTAILTTAGGDSCEWNTGETTVSIKVCPKHSTEYKVKVFKDGCAGEDSVAVLVNPLPNIDLGEDTTIAANDTIKLDAGEGFSDYNWSNGSTGQSITIIASKLKTGIYNYSVNVTDLNSA